MKDYNGSNMKNYKSIVVVCATLLFLVVIGYSLYNLMDRAGKIGVSVTLFPSDIQATLDGRELHNSTMYFEPGTYTLKASKSGFESISRTFIVNETQKTLVVAPTAVSPEAKEWAKKNADKIQEQQQIHAAEIGKDFNRRNPIAIHLPYKTFFYSVGYRMDKSDPSGNSIIIEIDAREGYRQSALYRIRQLGYDPTDFTINFRNYENPFSL
jgi:hypothetical protein